MKKLLTPFILLCISVLILSSCVNKRIEKNKDINSSGEVKMKMFIEIGEEKLEATLVDNSSTRALKELVEENGNKLKLNLDDYNMMEKVGPLPKKLPRNDEQINTTYGDLILYLGSSFVIYYDNNSWSLTRLGRIDNVSKEELKRILGKGSVEITLSF